LGLQFPSSSCTRILKTWTPPEGKVKEDEETISSIELLKLPSKAIKAIEGPESQEYSAFIISPFDCPNNAIEIQML